MKRWPLSRRHVLRGAGGAVIALPLLEAMGRAEAPRRRFIALTVPHGTIPDLWFPAAGSTETSFQLTPILSVLEPYKSDLIVFQGIDNKTNGNGDHAGSEITYLTGRNFKRGTDPNGADNTSTGISVDQEMAKVVGAQTPFASLNLGTAGAGNVFQILSYAGAGQPRPNTSVAKTLFDRLFASANMDPAARQRWTRRMSILDGAKQDFQALKRRLGKADTQRVDAHLAAIAQLERQFQGTACSPGGTLPGQTNDWTRKLPEMMKEMLEVVVLALKCDLTRVLTYMIRQEGSYSALTFGWLGIGPPGDPYGVDSRPDPESQSHHAMSHYDSTPANRDRLMRVGQWYASQLAYLIKRLKETADGNGTLFDSTAIFYGSPLGKGNHTTRNLPLLIAGSGGGVLRTNRFLKYDGASHVNLLLSLLQAMGGTATTFGDPALCTGPLPGLT